MSVTSAQVGARQGSAPASTPDYYGGRTAAVPLYVGAVADTFGGALHGSFPLALAVRALLLVLFVVWVLDSPRTPNRVRTLLLVMFTYLAASTFLHYLNDPSMAQISMDVSAGLRLIYAPLLLGYIVATMRAGLLSPERARGAAVLFGWLVLLSLFLGKITGLGGEIGGRGTNIEAGKGFMIGGNEVGLMLILSCPFVVIDMHWRLRNMALTASLALALYVAAGLYVFTKSSLGAPVTCAACLYGLCRQRRGSALLVARLSLIAAATSIVLLCLHYLDEITAFANTTFFGALFNEGLFSFLFRGRQDYIDALFPQLESSDHYGLILLFGLGEYTLRQLSLAPLSLGATEGTNFEMDIFDLVGAYGLVGAGLYAALLYRLFRTLPERNHLGHGVRFAIFATVLHSFMAGHVIFSPQVMTLLLLLLAAAARPDAPRCSVSP